MRPLPWSHSALGDFKNCPRSFHQKRVLKRFPPDDSEQIRWGNYVHKAFELRIAEQKPLPVDLKNFEPYMAKLEKRPGETYAERKIAFDKMAKPCSFFYPAVWYRGVIDFTNVHKDHALIVDYKTGKPHEKFDQLISNALHTFALYPEVETCEVRYFWTKTQSETKRNYTRDQIAEMWGRLIPDLRQYRDAFHSDTWQPRPSGLCNGWCPVTDCEFWKPKRKQ